ncbi:MAG: tRNA uridine-5-carboxymethylaminomethyl(34) synthesis GTPase MnmE [Oscillospiraceae bacterium]|nr:tRNA uridine-5-carboxymethylaminomethyl(34) synthesis GTPase MnmE [Oscillospiraceae bacterium]
MLNNAIDTIAAISSPFAQGGIGVIRISGPEAKDIASKVFKSIFSKSIFDLSGYQALFGNVFDDQGVFDEAILLNFNAPHSYTGEDVVEISVHSGLYILKRVLRAVINAGARLAQAGEFTKRAFLNNKMSLTQAESVMDLISAQSEQAFCAALTTKQGFVFKNIVDIIDKLLELDSHISAWIDYPEEDIISINKQKILDIILKTKDKLTELILTFDTGKILKEGINTVIVGKPNVGKSTLMNLLSGVNKSIVTNIPGTTRDIIEENILLDDILINLFDTAGLRETYDLVEKTGVSLAKEKIKEADVVLAVFDNSREFDQEDQITLEQVKNKKIIAVVNKTDLLSEFEIDKIKEYTSYIIKVNSNDIKTKNIISKEIKRVLKIENINSTSVIISNERQLHCLKKAVLEIDKTIDSINNNFTYDAISVDIESIIEYLMELTGQKVSESVVDKVFSNFCVGK